MSDVYGAVAPDQPPAQIPEGVAPDGRLHITVRPRPAVPALADTVAGQPAPATAHDQQPADPYAGVFQPYAPPSEAKAGAPAADDPYKDTFTPYEPPKHDVKPDVGAGSAAGAGLMDSMSFGTLPAVLGASDAGATDKTVKEGVDLANRYGGGDGAGLAIPLTGLIKMWQGDPVAKEAYERGRSSVEEDMKTAKEQHPWAFLTGQLAGALAGPKFGAVGGTSAATRIAHGVGAGAVGGGLYGAGEALGEGKDLSDILKSGASGAAVGSVFGGAGGAGAEIGGAAANKIGTIVRGARKPEDQASRNVVQALGADTDKRGGLAISREEADAADAASTPMSVMDFGGQNTRDLARKAGNLSSDAWETLHDATQKRFENQAPRISQFIHGLFGPGGIGAGEDQLALKQAARVANRPAYAKAYAAGDKPVWSPELERIVGSPDVVQAMKGAAATGKTRAIAEGMGAFNPKAEVTQDGRLLFPKGQGGVPTYPNLQFWDYTYRNVRDAADAAFRQGRNSEGEALKGVATSLRSELDRIVPEYQQARGTAASFFGAADASEAGEKFVMANADLGEARRALAKMTAPERELFARGFASELSDKVMRTGDTQNVLDKVFIDSHLARQKIAMALGPARAQQLEALLRVESLVDKARGALGNSTTARQMRQLGMSVGHGVGGAGAVGAFEAVKEHDFNPAHIVMGALVLGAARHGAAKVDEKVAGRVATMLSSSDPAVLRQGLKIVTASPTYFNALRAATSAAGRVAGHDLGASGTAAMIYAGRHAMGEGEEHSPDNAGYSIGAPQDTHAR